MKKILEKNKNDYKMNKEKLEMTSIGLTRIGNEEFYTKENIAKICYESIRDLKIIERNELIIEPSAGNGSFIPYIKELSERYLFYDIQPFHEEIRKEDFLQLDLNNLKEPFHIIGNPPFGRQSSLAKKFIKNCSSASSISFILPKSFKKESLQKTFPLNFHLIHEIDLPKNSFTVRGIDHDVPCIFQIWKKESHERKIEEKVDPVNFQFVKKEEKHDISVRRVGVNAGEIDTKTKNKSASSHYFIKFTDPTLLSRLEEYRKLTFPSENTVGPKSISKPELIKEFNKIL